MSPVLTTPTSKRYAAFAHTFNGYEHFGESWGERLNEARSNWEETGELPAEIDDLRACLFLKDLAGNRMARRKTWTFTVRLRRGRPGPRTPRAGSPARGAGSASLYTRLLGEELL